MLFRSERLLQYLHPYWETVKNAVDPNIPMWMLKFGYINLVKIQRIDMSIPGTEKQKYHVEFLFARGYLSTREFVNITIEELKQQLMEQFLLSQVSDYSRRTLDE